MNDERTKGTIVVPAVTRLRPTAVLGDRITIGDIEAILDAVDQWDEDASIHIVSPYADDEKEAGGHAIVEHPWSTEWTGVALVVHGAGILVPIVGEWPFGPDHHADDEPGSIHIDDVVSALRQLTTQAKGADARGVRFVAHDESMQRTIDVLIAHAQSDEKTAQVVEFCDDGDGTLLCEIGMDEHGLPVLFMESSGCSQHDVDIDYEKRLAISRIEPLCMTARTAEFVFDGQKTSTVVLTPVRDMDSLETLEGRMHDPIEIIRILAAHAARISAADTGLPDTPEKDADQ